MSFCGGAFGMVSAQWILIRHEVDPCTCDRSMQESGSMFLIQSVLSNNGALNCSTGSNVVVLLNCGSQVNTRVSYANLLLSLSLSFFLSSSLFVLKFIFVFVYCNSRICRIHFIFVYFVRSGFRTKVKCVLKVQIESAVEQCTRST